ncbi:MAG: hypothetical protein MMC23_009653 [Stictis urceolatum]|nr:hypothetical protein [Stictis urceolata]
MAVFNAPNFKVETESTAAKELQHIRMEAGNTGVPADEDIYEDAGDLDFSSAAQAFYLTRLPKYLWKTWAQLGDDAEVEVGTIRIEGDLNAPKRMSLMLSDGPVNETLPKEYNMQISNRNTINTFIFTEKDFPGFSQRTKEIGNPSRDGPAQPFSQAAPRIAFHDRFRFGAQQTEKGKRFSYHRKGVPKKTSFVGQVQTEVNCLPVENEQYRRIMDERTRSELKPKREIQFITAAAPGANSLNPGTLGNSGTFTSFIKPNLAQRGKGQDLKAARMPQNELLDLIYECFKRYSYWPLKTLKAELNQPEAYLRQTLEMVAQLVRQGPHAMTWQLKPEAKISAYADTQSFDQAKDQAPEAIVGFDGASDTGEGILSDEEDVKMEDVMPT